jgi:GTP-binding protein YchF
MSLLALNPAAAVASRGSSTSAALEKLKPSSGSRRTSGDCRMALKTGIVGLPNVGKSTLFNALMKESQAQAANYPFCTIDPNTGVVAVPDKRLDVLAKISSSAKITPTSLSFVDIAGLVKGASKGEGLGNKFLANIRECDAIVHVVRCFEDENVIHVDGSVDPIRDIEVISLELIFADEAQIENRLLKLKKDVKQKKDGAQEELDALEKIQPVLAEGKPARFADLSDDEWKRVKNLGLLSAKPVVYAANVLDSEVSEGNEMVESVKKYAASEKSACVMVSAQVESELVDLGDEERQDFLSELGIEESGLDKLIPEAYKLLGLRTYFTTGDTETRAWTIKEGWRAPQAAGVIHTDFERGFIKAETVSYDDLVSAGQYSVAKEKGKVRQEGKDYEVQEADCILFKFNV